ncbi:phosphocholine-specific phospholipase C [Dyella tabacisoli]|uniref:phospholipase C n=1 Tax=Dyella tabacisoli TaxID=2282381 RepID=A0A369UHP7_9GAMM|nr:phospholipase C, phosphocholine-specific [Dyella tabacisoli]RDD80007.1 phospholipase C, phosphocholine-specific [Dyella tabacisoli]
MSEIDDIKRRRFLKMTAGSAGGIAALSVWPGLIEKALAIEPHNPTGNPSLADVEHVIIFMQENRSFDHYFGMLPGVRGYGDPRPVPMPSGNYVWYQPEGLNPGSRGFSAHVPHADWTQPAGWYNTDRGAQSANYVLPFRLNQPGNVQFQYMSDLDHSWKASQDTWRNWDTWVPLKSRQSMGCLNSDDLPFYYQLANAFTVCDAYHCSIFSATDPNRFCFWSGTVPPPMNFPDNYGSCGYVSDIQCDINTGITPAMYGQSPQARSAAVAAGIADWKTYPETLTDNRITWKVYQEYDNYGDNYLQYFKNFRIDNSGASIDKSSDPYFQSLYQRGRVFAAASGKTGDAIIAEFAKDVAAGMEPDNPDLGTVKSGLPRVSWIVAPAQFCEHPSSSPGDGESFTARLLNVLVNDHPDVFQKTVFMLMYDENDGYFDHVPPPIPPITAHYGEMTLADAGAAENNGSIPVGLGPRVPMLIISPWTAGGKVYSQLSDHTSVLQFLEQWSVAKGLGTEGRTQCTAISDWRRSVCGDLTEAFDFRRMPAKPINTTTTFKNGTAHAAVPDPQVFPIQTPLARPACRLGYAFSAGIQVDTDSLALAFANTGTVGVALIAYCNPMSSAQEPYHYMVAAGESLLAAPAAIGDDDLYDWAVYGPNGFLREFRGDVKAMLQSGQAPEVTTSHHALRGNILIKLDNRASLNDCVFQVTDNAYYENDPLQIRVEAGRERTIEWRGCSGWYDASVRLAGDAVYFRRLAGCVQHRLRSPTTDPAIGNNRMFGASFSIHGHADTLRFDYAVPPWHHRPKNWLGVFPAGAAPTRANLLQWVYAPRGVGSVMLSTSGKTPLPSGRYDVWYFFDDGYTPLGTKPVSLKI